MITDAGKLQIKRYMAKYTNDIARAIVIGVGSRAENPSDINLQFEIAKAQVKLITYDFVNDTVIFKATIPESAAGKIYEVGVVSQYIDPTSGIFATKTLAQFDSNANWSDLTTGAVETYDATNSRIGVNSLRHTPAASATKTSSLKQITNDLSGYSASDIITLAVNIGNTNTSSVKVRFLTDSSNYYEFTSSTPVHTTGYKVLDFVKASATVVGAPNWAIINEIQISTISTAGGASQADWDGLIIHNSTTTNLDYVLVGRKVLTTPLTKTVGKPLDVEFSLEVNL